jgi:hypothetical protein
MTTDQQEKNKAAVVFTTILTVFAGGAGLAVAGLILGADYLLHGEPHERERLAQQRADRARDRYADALAWLDNDRAERERHRQATREWFGADPDTRGDKPSSGETVGTVLGRGWNNMLVGWGRFLRGWRKGRADARQRRAAGDSNWWKPKPEQDEEPGDERGEQPETPQAKRPDSPDPQPQEAAEDDGIVDAEIVPDAELPAGNRDVVPVGQDESRRPDESLNEYQRRLDDLATEVQQNRNGHLPDPSQTALR